MANTRTGSGSSRARVRANQRNGANTERRSAPDAAVPVGVPTLPAGEPRTEMKKKDLLKTKVEHISLDTFNPTALIDSMEKMAFQARNTARAARIYEMMLKEKECAVVLCLAGSLISAGLKKVFVQMIENDMVDAIVSTGANIVDQDFFE